MLYIYNSHCTHLPSFVIVTCILLCCYDMYMYIVCVVQLARVSQELLMSICMNCGDKDGGDLEVMTSLIKMRMKTKPLINHYLACIR